LVVFASLNAMDGINCPDGCTREDSSSQSRSPQPSDGICALCQGGVQPSTGDDFFPIGLIAKRVRSSLLTNLEEISPDPPEHPPRS
jgi:hypothetical protein